MCGCPKENLTVVYRWSTKELERMERVVSEASKQPLASCIVMDDGNNSGLS